MLRFILEVTIGLAAFIWGCYNPDGSWGLKGLAFGFWSSAMIGLVIFIYQEHNFLNLYLNIFTKPRKKVRLTLAYLFKIEEQGRYLLVESNRIPGCYQPVGGVYKYFPTAKRFLDCLHAHPDHHINQDDDSENDLRLMLAERWRLRKFLKWFFQKEQRESDPWREFQEELVSTGILPHTDFHYIHHELLGQHMEQIHFDTRFQVDTFKYVDIFSLHYISPTQQTAIRNLLTTASTTYLWATHNEIESEMTTTGLRILPHTKKILHPQKLSLC